MTASSIIEFLVVGRTPLGGALRAGLIGVLATSIATWFFTGTSGPFVVGAAVVVTVLPIAYMLSKRDDMAGPPPGGIPGPGDGPVPPMPPPDRPAG